MKKIISEFVIKHFIASKAQEEIVARGMQGWSFCGETKLKEEGYNDGEDDVITYYVFQKEMPSPEEALWSLLQGYARDMDNFYDATKGKFGFAKEGYTFIAIPIWDKDKFDDRGYDRLPIPKFIVGRESYILFYKEAE